MIEQATFLDFIIRTCLVWIVVFFAYKVFLSKSKWHITNRVILIVFLIVPFLLPFINWDGVSGQIPTMSTVILPEINLKEIDSASTTLQINLLYFYAFIAFILLIKNGITFFKTLKIKAEKPFFYYNNHKIYLLKDTTAFNFLNQIYIGESLKNKTSVLDHEIIHKQAKHSLDLLFITLLRSLFWVFPFWNMIAKLFKENHEYYVDQKLLQTIKLSDYLKQISLAGPFKFEEQFGLTSNQMSIFKTRLQMMKNNHKSQLWRYLLILGISGATFIACDKANTEIEENSVSKHAPTPPPPPLPIYPSNERSIKVSQADVFPTWDGCSDGDQTCFQQGLMNHIQSNFTYPKAAKQKGEEGKAFVGFQFSTKGEVKNISLYRKTDSELLNEEALRLIKSLPKIAKPAYKDGKPVAVQYVIPINFKIK